MMPSADYLNGPADPLPGLPPAPLFASFDELLFSFGNCRQPVNLPTLPLTEVFRDLRPAGFFPRHLSLQLELPHSMWVTRIHGGPLQESSN